MQYSTRGRRPAQTCILSRGHHSPSSAMSSSIAAQCALIASAARSASGTTSALPPSAPLTSPFASVLDSGTGPSGRSRSSRRAGAAESADADGSIAIVLPVVASRPARCGGPWRHPPPCDTASSVSGCEGARLSLPRVSSRPLASSCSRTAASTTRGGTTGLGSGVEQIPPMSIGGARDATKGRRGVGLGANPCPSVRVC